MTDTTPDSPRRTPHFVSQEPWDPYVADRLTAEQERYYMAGQWKLMWWRFRRHKPAVVSMIFLLLMYFSTLIREFIAPYDLHTRHSRYIFAAPQGVHLFHEGSFLGPFVYGLKMERDPATLQRIYSEDKTKPQQLRFFCLGESYEFWGLIEGSFHFVSPPEDGTFFLLGTDRLGRDMFSRIVYAARISLTIGIIGIALSFALALILGGLAGYYGGWIDSVVQRLTEIIKSFPHLPLWLALSAALPVTWSPLLVYFGITIILALLDWPGLGRAVRSKLLSLREEDYAAAAQMMGAKPARIIGRHLLQPDLPPGHPGTRACHQQRQRGIHSLAGARRPVYGGNQADQTETDDCQTLQDTQRARLQADAMFQIKRPQQDQDSAEEGDEEQRAGTDVEHGDTGGL